MSKAIEEGFQVATKLLLGKELTKMDMPYG